jgi:aryl-alcohol dehydrogenase-like predicted oxidoreductase
MESFNIHYEEILMEFTSLPNIEQKVSRVGLGTWAMGGFMWGGTDEKNAIETIHRALDLGINLIDTAPVYGFGLSEEIVGKAMKLYGKREKIILATKVGLSWEGKKVYRDAKKGTLLKEFDASLKRLQVDYIDVYQVHWPDSATPISETAQTLNQLLKQGKIRAIGVSNFSVEQMEEFQQYAPLHLLQSPFNLFEREIEDKELAYCLQKGIAVLGYGALCRGLLTGKMSKTTQFEGDDLRKVDPKFQEPRYTTYLRCVQKLEEWGQKNYKKPLLALAVRWSLDKGIDVALWGARYPRQLEGMDGVWGWKLTKTDLTEIDHILKETILSPVGPGFMAPP